MKHLGNSFIVPNLPNAPLHRQFDTGAAAITWRTNHIPDGDKWTLAHQLLIHQSHEVSKIIFHVTLSFKLD